VRVDTFKEILRSTPQLQVALNRYSAGLGMQVAQTAACNRLHKIEERLARWLLMAQDRVNSDIISITHDFLATMLGTDRPTERDPGSRYFAAKTDHWLYARRRKDCEP
jgi:CRP-like cAMP-binding protein